MADDEDSKDASPWMPLSEFADTFFPRPGAVLRVGEPLGSDRRAAVFQQRLRDRRIEARGFFNGSVSNGKKPLPAEPYDFSDYTRGRLECRAHPGWWSDVEIRFTPALPEPAVSHPEPDIRQAPGTPCRRARGRPSDEQKAALASFDEKYPGGKGIPEETLIGAARAMKRALGLAANSETIAGWIGKHLKEKEEPTASIASRNDPIK